MVGRFEPDELMRPTALTLGRALLPAIGWDNRHIIVFDLQTREGASFRPGGYPKADLDKHKIWVCPLFEPFLAWLYQQNLDDLDALPSYVDLGSVPIAMQGYRRSGPVDITVPAAAGTIIDDLFDGKPVVAKPVRNCNRHNDCNAADERAKARGATYGTDHCHDDECSDCFGN